MTVSAITPSEVRRMLLLREEIALLDLRHEATVPRASAMRTRVGTGLAAAALMFAGCTALTKDVLVKDAGRPATPVAQLQFAEMRELQQLLQRQGYNVGKVDGILGQQSRIAIKAMQVKFGLPADSWPTHELLVRMGGRAAPPQQPPPPTPPKSQKAR